MIKIKTEIITLRGLRTTKFATVMLLSSVDSTNNYLLQNRNLLKDGTVVLTLNQTGGRGRNGHDWKGGGLAISVLLKKEGYFPAQLPLAAAVAAANALSKLTGYKAKIKWPNDILMDGKKICGILCESKSASNKEMAAVCGAGFNLLQEESFFKEAGLPYAASVFMQTSKRVEYTEMAEEYLNELSRSLDRLAEDTGGLLKDYRDLCLTLGKEVRVIPNGITGRAADITDRGSLLIEAKDGVKEVYGEVSIRGISGYAD